MGKTLNGDGVGIGYLVGRGFILFRAKHRSVSLIAFVPGYCPVKKVLV